MTPLPLFALPPPPKPTCPLCGLALKGAKRCRVCAKGDLPRPGSPAWRRWTSGILRTIRARLAAAGLSDLETDACSAIVWDRGDLPPAVAPLLADLAALPCSLRRYRALEARAFLLSQALYRLYEGPNPPTTREEADRRAEAAVDARLARRDQRLRIAPVEARIALPPAVPAPVFAHDEEDALRAELEATADPLEAHPHLLHPKAP